MIESFAPVSIVGLRNGKLSREADHPDSVPLFCLIVKCQIPVAGKTINNGPHKIVTDGINYFRTEQLGELIDDVPEQIRESLIRILKREVGSII